MARLLSIFRQKNGSNASETDIKVFGSASIEMYQIK